jgi:2,3,4,5-tetrahydropyridine-2-carboxylate N-succinyltransferase
MNTELQARIEHAFDNRAALDVAAIEALKPDLYHVIALLESGDARVAEPQDGGWKVNEWLKKAVLLYFRCHDMDVMGEPGNPFWDKVPLRFENYDAEDFRRLGARVVPGTVARAGSYIGKDAVLMPSFINIGAHVGAGRAGPGDRPVRTAHAGALPGGLGLGAGTSGADIRPAVPRRVR